MFNVSVRIEYGDVRVKGFSSFLNFTPVNIKYIGEIDKIYSL